MGNLFQSVTEQAKTRAVESTLGVLGITNPVLREHLSNVLYAECGEDGGLLASPVFEQTFGWKAAPTCMKDLAQDDGIFTNDLIQAIDTKGGKPRFAPHWKPHTHQLASWRSLIENRKSIVVTSGTGSGKTECFMIPILDDLIREYLANDRKPLVGVRALFLYPLNALINSQRQRLDAWTERFGKGIRYCLYNGNTEERRSKMSTQQQQHPNEVLSREQLREEPAPILVTNGTMLEYMMIRQIDAPIIEKSREQKSLRWIVLDEAHTYIGSQAAELALQLRRVMATFRVSPEDVRFVATSATIAEEGGADRLREFLANLTGVRATDVDVIDGTRDVPVLPKAKVKPVSLTTLDEVTNEDAPAPDVYPERYEMLLGSPVARLLRATLVGKEKAVTLTHLAEVVQNELGQSLSQDELLHWLDVCCSTRPSEHEPPFLRLRAHLFQRAMHGLWACFNPRCSKKAGTALQEDWPFGYVYTDQRQRCDCGSPVFELVLCNNCGTPHLYAQDDGGTLAQWQDQGGDEFTLEADDNDEEPTLPDRQDSTVSRRLVVLCGTECAEEKYPPFGFDHGTGVFTSLSDDAVRLGLCDHDYTCSNADCGATGRNGEPPFRRALLGSPFYISNAVPMLLEHCEDFKNRTSREHGPNSLPGRGKRLITFTDSRQGTARLSIRMQQEAERSRLRGLVVETLSNRQRQETNAEDGADLDPAGLEEAIRKQESTIVQLRATGLEDVLKREIEHLQRLKVQLAAMQDDKGTSSRLVTMSWDEMVGELASSADIQGPMLVNNKVQKPEIFDAASGPKRLTEMLLFREFMRRPKRQNSLETQGLVGVGYKNFDKVIKVPELWDKAGLDIKDWRDFLKVALDFFVRENNYIRADQTWRHWIGSRFAPKTLRNPLSQEPDELRSKRWPQIRGGSHSQRLIKLLLLGGGLDPADHASVDMVNLWLRCAWNDLTKTTMILEHEGNQFSLSRKNMTFMLLTQAHVCPVTNKLLDTVFKDLTPYLPMHIDFSKLTERLVAMYKTERTELPAVWKFDRSQEDYATGIRQVRKAVRANETVADLRARSLWTDINDRAVEGGFYYRVAEHSAQQPSSRLNAYEKMFREGQINVLNCSTTMEMGVDIGGISAVAMTNVPPHPANYLQRSGRAGRGDDPKALTFTLCKSNPHDQQVFENPKWPFTSIIPAPKVALNSERLVQRHVNALLLSTFLIERVGASDTERTKLNTEWFYLGDEGSAPCDRFIRYLELAESPVDATLDELVRGTALAGVTPSLLRKRTHDHTEKLRERWKATYQHIAQEVDEAKAGSAYQTRLRIERTRHCGEYLLRHLAARTFLPGYGFPTDVVNFDNFTIEDYVREKKRQQKSDRMGREDNIAHYKGLPSRNLAVAIREYAPGADIAIDGRVFRSAGISLHWHNLSRDSRESQKLDVAWRCKVCGTSGYVADLDEMEELTCSNSECRAAITERNKVLVPSGFVTDVYRDASNDVGSQQFIPVAEPWVSLEAATVPLPNPTLGSMAWSANGQVFHHSEGLHGTGFAVCLTCGRAESMNPNGEFPDNLNPDTDHYSPRPGPDDKDDLKRRIACSGSATIQRNISLGSRTFTDVFELALRNPKTGKHIPDSGPGRVIATTLAVALRNALAAILGIEATELGHATRPVKLAGGETIRVLQLFDLTSGGAGFASSAPQHIEHLLKDMVANLHCSHCKSACNDCLLDASTRHDCEKLDRSQALVWLGERFGNHVALRDEDQLGLPEAAYAPGGLEDAIRYLISQGANQLTLFTNRDTSDWDLLAPAFNRAVRNYLIDDALQVTLVISNTIKDDELLSDLRQLQVRDVQLAAVEKPLKIPVAVQARLNGHNITLATESIGAITPGPHWHQPDGLVVRSDQYPVIELKELALPVVGNEGATIKEIQILDEFNGELDKFGARLWHKIQKEVPNAAELLDNHTIQDVSYSDRYIQSPTALMLLGAVLGQLRKHLRKKASIHLDTWFKVPKGQSNKLFHNWDDEDAFEAFACAWLGNRAGTTVNLTNASTGREIAHHRKLTLTFENGSVMAVRFDQGMGYWQVRFPSRNDIWFDFTLSVEDQLANLSRRTSAARVRNSSDQWKTDIVVAVEH